MSALPTLAQGASGFSVHNLQALLNTHGAGLAEDSSFGPKTLSAVRNFQSSSKIGVDGVVGQHTWSVLLLGHDL